MSSKGGAKISIAVSGKAGGIQLSGRANVACSVLFREVVEHLRTENIDEIFLFLESCLVMDSTFLGVLASLGIPSKASGSQKDVRIKLVSPSERVLALIENLGVLDSFEVAETKPSMDFAFQEVSGSIVNDLQEVTRTSLEAHRTLIQLNEANRARFEGVTTLLEKELEGQDSPSKRDG